MTILLSLQLYTLLYLNVRLLRVSEINLKGKLHFTEIKISEWHFVKKSENPETFFRMLFSRWLLSRNKKNVIVRDYTVAYFFVHYILCL